MSEHKYTLSKEGKGIRPAVMWAWTDRINSEDTVYQLHAFKEAGFREFYIHPGWTSDWDDYLSEFYMSQVKLACDTAESIGLNYSVYDENAWPSGTCGGKLLEQHPEYRMSYLRWEKADVQAGDPMDIWFRGKLLAVKVQYADKLRTRADITDKVRIDVIGAEEGGRAFWTNNHCCTASVWVFSRFYEPWISPTAKWSSYSNYAPGLTDVCNPDAVKAFLEMNNGVYRDVLGKRFGKTIHHIFTDETSMAGINPQDTNMRPYSEHIEEEFYSEHGYDVRAHFIALSGAFESEEDLKVRYDYHKTCTRLFTQNFLQQYADWCHQNDLLLTGHMSAEGVLFHHTVRMGDFYEALSKFDIPGVDNIVSKPGMHKDYAAYEAKLTASVAKFAGKERTMCETFSGSGWDLSLEDSKYIINEIMLLGISYIIFMTAGYSLNGLRNIFPVGYPPSHGYNNPLFPHYHTLIDYTAVRSSLMTQTKACGHVLIMLPQIDAWTHLDTSMLGTRRNSCWMYASFGFTKKSVEYDIFFEPLAKDSRVCDGKFIVKDFAYDTIVVPYMGSSDQCTLDLIEDFVKQGGKTVFVDKYPTLAVDTGKHYDFEALMPEQAKGFFQSVGDTYSSYEDDRLKLIYTGTAKELPADKYYADLAAFTEKGHHELIEAVSPTDEIRLARRYADGLYCCMVLNKTDQSKTVELKIHDSGKLTLLKETAFYDCEITDGYISLLVAPHDMPVLILTKPGVTLEGLAHLTEPKLPTGTEKKLVLDKGWKVTTDNNILPLKIKYLTKAQPCGTLSKEIQKLAETTNAPYAIQEFPVDAGLSFGDSYAAYARFEVIDIPEYSELFSEVTEDGEVWLNGHKLENFTHVHERGPNDRVTNITGILQKGTNVVVILHHMPAWKCAHKIPALAIRGSFRLDAKENIIKPSEDIDIAKYYTEQGLRYYSGTLSYTNTFNLDEESPENVSIEVETKEVAEIIVNGISAGVYCWKPYKADITRLCKPGENSIEIIFTTTYEPTMILENIVYIAQGISEYREDVKPQEMGTHTPPVIRVISSRPNN